MRHCTFPRQTSIATWVELCHVFPDREPFKRSPTMETDGLVDPTIGETVVATSPGSDQARREETRKATRQPESPIERRANGCPSIGRLCGARTRPREYQTHVTQ